MEMSHRNRLIRCSWFRARCRYGRFALIFQLFLGISGYFHSILSDRKVAGPIVTTQSEYDYALGRLYPLAAE